MHQQAQHIMAGIEHHFGESNDPASWQDLADKFPWYPTAWLGLYSHLDEPRNALRQLALFVHEPLRLQLLSYASRNGLQIETVLAKGQPIVVPPETAMPAQEKATFSAATNSDATVEPASTHTIIDQQLQPAAATENTAPNAMEPAENPAPAEARISLPGEAGFVFQPYHTVDYFAALGIKIDPQALETTRFDRQLKSFTQWLKTMKRLEKEPNSSTETDAAVDKQAANSVLVEEIITEAMAEVLVKQGKREQALGIYAKLTLLHPEKSALFAAQIEKLNEI